MKLTVLGGGGFRVPLIHGALLRDPDANGVREVALHDPDPERLDAIHRVLRAQASGHPAAPAIHAHTDAEPALRDASFVFAAIRVGGLAGRTTDERVALDHGLLGQETTGAGGIAYGLRTLPEMLRYAELIDRICPRAWVVNFTNPAGMVTEAMQRVLGDRVIGICDSPLGLGRRAARAAGIDPAQARFDYAGLNHLGWLRGLSRHGTDLLPGLLADDEALAGFEEGALFGADWLRTLGAIPNEYLYYYYRTREAIAAIRGGPRTRGEFLLEQQSAFYAAVRDGHDPASAHEQWRTARADRDASYMAEARGAAERDQADIDEGGYEGVAVAVLAALSGATPVRLPLNVRNATTLPGLGADAVVEVPCLVDTDGARPLATSPLAGHQLGLVATVKEAEQHAIAAVTRRSKAAAVAAFAVHPLVDSVATAEILFDRYRASLPGLVELFG